MVDQWVKPLTLDFGSGCDLMGGIEPHVGSVFSAVCAHDSFFSLLILLLLLPNSHATLSL